jgi:glycosyltransferase involved in cell wall biosynthesis
MTGLTKVSVIYSIFNEEKNQFFWGSLSRYKNIKGIEIICVDGGSSDKTIKMLSKYSSIKVIESIEKKRSKRLNIGIQESMSDLVLLHHPRSIMDEKALEYLVKESLNLKWGGYTHQFDRKNIFFKFTSWYSNIIRFDLKNIIYLDHCIFVRKEFLFKIGCLETIDIFEDTVLSLNLKKISKPKRLNFNVITSSIRFTKNGIIKQSLLNQFLKILFLLKFDNKKMNKEYEKNLNLNSKYE